MHLSPQCGPTIPLVFAKSSAKIKSWQRLVIPTELAEEENALAIFDIQDCDMRKVALLHKQYFNDFLSEKDASDA